MAESSKIHHSNEILRDVLYWRYCWNISHIIFMISLLNVLKRTVSRILAKFRHGKWPSNSVKYKNNLLKQWRNISITQQLQKKARVAKSDEDWNGLQYVFFKNCWAEQFSNLGWLIMVFIIFQHLYFEESVLPLLITYCYSNGYFCHVIFMFYC